MGKRDRGRHKEKIFDNLSPGYENILAHEKPHSAGERNC